MAITILAIVIVVSYLVFTWALGRFVMGGSKDERVMCIIGGIFCEFAIALIVGVVLGVREMLLAALNGMAR